MKTNARIARSGLPLALLAALLLAGCARTGPPAPVVYGGQNRTAVQPQKQAALPPAERHRAAATPRRADRSIVVKPGDTIYTIARDNGVPLRALIDANRLRAPYALDPGRRLTLPAAGYHIVQRGDTLYGIARKYGVDMRALVRANDIAPPYVIPVGRKLALPAAGSGGTGPSAVASAAPAAQPATRSDVSTSALPPAGSASPPGAAPDQRPAAAAPVTASSAPSNPPPEIASLPSRAEPAPAGEAEPPPRAGNGRFLWPIRGPILVGFGPRGGGLHNDGINIAAREGVEVRAAEAGVVAYAGNELHGFGNLLLIRHADNWMTAYGHASALLVKRGERVQRGQVIARVGSTGSVNRAQLHFEIRRNDKPVDPLPYLGRMTASIPSVNAAAFRGARRDPG